LVGIADKERLKRLLDKDNAANEQKAKLQKSFRKAEKLPEPKPYNLCETAKILNVHRQTIYYWIKKGWIKPKRDCRNYPIFTVFDIEKIRKWKRSVRE
jgi:DNA invertase Pin-like site-specific DNA recombinase